MELIVVNIVVNLVIGIVGFLIRQHLLAIRKDLDEVKEQVYKTNGKVIRLEEWKENHIASDSTAHEIVNTTLKEIKTRLDTLFNQKS